MRQFALLLVLGSTGCLAAPISQADSVLERRVEQLGAEATRTGDALAARVDAVRAAATADVDAILDRRIADVDARAAARVADIDARFGSRLDDVRGGLDAARVESAEWRAIAAKSIEESAKWRDEFAKWREEASSLRAAFTGAEPAAPARPDAPDLPPEDKAAMWFAVAGAAFTLAKTGRRIWLDRKAARTDV